MPTSEPKQGAEVSLSTLNAHERRAAMQHKISWVLWEAVRAALTDADPRVSASVRRAAAAPVAGPVSLS
jgi:hypothetical protein